MQAQSAKTLFQKGADCRKAVYPGKTAEPKCVQNSRFSFQAEGGWRWLSLEVWSVVSAPQGCTPTGVQFKALLTRERAPRVEKQKQQLLSRCHSVATLTAMPAGKKDKGAVSLLCERNTNLQSIAVRIAIPLLTDRRLSAATHSKLSDRLLCLQNAVDFFFICLFLIDL